MYPGAYFTPRWISGCQLWAKADGITGLNDGDAIGSWTDSSGSGNTLTQATTANKPTYKSAIVNGLPVVRFTSASSTSMICSASAGQKPVTLFAVVRASALGTGGILNRVFGGNGSGSGNNGIAFGLRGGPNAAQLEVYDTFSSNVIATSASGSIAANVWYVIEATYSSTGDYALYKNGSQLVTPGTNNITPASIPRRIGGSDNGVDMFDGDIGEVLQYNSVLSSTDRASVRAYLGGKYAIAVS